MAKGQNITKILTQDPLRTLTVGITIIGVFVSMANFYILSRISPLAARVEAIERRNAGADVLIPQFYLLQSDVGHIKSDIADIKIDIREVISRMNNQEAK